MFDPEQAQRIQQALENMTPEQMDNLMNRLVQKLVDDGYINTDQQQANETGPGGTGNADRKVEVRRSPTNPSISWDSRR